MTTVEEHLDNVFVTLLERGGVDNWTWYEDAMEEVENPEDSSEVAQTLLNNGVDNWEWYEASLDDFFSYSEYVELNPNDYLGYDEWVKQKEQVVEVETESRNEENVEVVRSPQGQMLFDYISQTFDDVKSEEIFDKINPTLWKRNNHTKEFDKAIKITKPKKNSNYVVEAAKNFLNLMIENGKLDKIIKENS